MVQGLVNSFGPTVMAAFAAAVKIDSFAYMPVQEFGNAFSTFIAQNYGAKKKDRIHLGLKGAIITSFIFSIDSFAYMPVQEFGNAFSTFIAQNYGAKKKDRIHLGLKGAIITSFIFSISISLIVCLFGNQLMQLFIDASETKIIYEGVRYLRIEGAFYFLLWYWLFILTLWPLSCIRKPGHECYLNHNIFRNSGSISLYAFCNG